MTPLERAFFDLPKDKRTELYGQMPEEEKKRYRDLWKQQTAAAPQNLLSGEEDPTVKGRLVAKNFLGNSEADMIKHLQKENPDKEFKFVEGAIASRPRESSENYFNPLDKPGFTKEDITDVGFDAANVAVTSAAEALGGLSPVPGGAPLAGAGAGAAMDFLRQMGAKAFAGKEGYDSNQTLLEAAFGAAAPIAMGSGTPTKWINKAIDKGGDQYIGKLVARSTGVAPMSISEAEKKAAKDFLLERQGNLITRNAPAMGEFLTPIPREQFKNSREMLPVVKKLEEGQNYLDMGKDISNMYNTNMKSALSGTGGKIGEVIKNSPVTFSTVDAIKAFDDNIANLRALGKASTDVEADLLEKQKKHLFSRNVKTVAEDGSEQIEQVIMTEMNPQQYFQLKQELGDLGGGSWGSSKPATTEFANMSAPTKNMSAVARKSGGKVSADIEGMMEVQGGKGLAKQYRELANIDRRWGPKLSDEISALNTMQTLSGKRKRGLYQDLKNADSMLDTNMSKYAQEMDAFKTWGDPRLTQTSTGGSTSTGRVSQLYNLLSSAARKVGLGNEGAQAVGTVGQAAFSPAAIRKGLETKYAVENFFGTPANLGLGGKIKTFPQMYQSMPVVPMTPIRNIGARSAWQYMQDANQ